MSRALRRQPLVQKPASKATSFRPAGVAWPQKKSATTVQAEAARKRSAYDRFMPAFVRDIINELKKVTWPTREETTRLTVAVLAVTITIGLALGGVDIGMNWLVDHTLLR